MKNIFTIILALLIAVSLQAKEKLGKTDVDAIKSLMQMQEDAWNRGDLNAFMKAYHNSPDLVFIGAKGPVYGYQQTLESYKKRYPTRAEMGETHFDLLEMYRIDSNTAFLIGKFYLERESGDLKGTFSLVLQKIDGKWLIISDHTSGDPD